MEAKRTQGGKTLGNCFVKTLGVENRWNPHRGPKQLKVQKRVGKKIKGGARVTKCGGLTNG